MRRSVPFLLLALPLLVCACDPASEAGADAEAEPAATVAAGASDAEAVEQAIRDRVEAFEQAANESAEAFSAFYASDGVLMPPNAPPAEGPAAIAEAMAPMFQTTENVTFEPVVIDVAESGELAVERGRYTLSGTAPDGSAFDDEGSYVVVWENQGGEWMVIHDIFNSDRAPQGAEGM